jgi:cytochrome P450
MRDEAPYREERLPVRPVHREGPAGLLRSYRTSQRNVLELIPAEAFRDWSVSGASPGRFHMIMAPEAIRRVLQTRVEDYPKADIARSILRPVIGDSMLIAEGAEWRRQRRAAAPAFQPRHLDALGPLMTEAAERASARVAGAEGRAADLLFEMTAATFEVISDVTFSGEPGVGREPVENALLAYGEAAARMSLLDVLGAPAWVPRPARMREDPSLRALKRHADARVAARRARPRSGAPDLLDLLLAAEGGGAEQLAGDDVRDNLLAFIVAGHETTALTLAWSLYLLGFDEAAQERARHEARDVLGGRAAGAEDVPNLPFVRAVIDEALRLYPPAAFLSRAAREVDELAGCLVLPGDTVSVPIYAVHRHQRLWERPDAFDPARFLGGPPVERYAYLPFGDGPRVCIGARFALQEAVIILATLLARFRFRAVRGKAPVPTLVITLRPEGGVWMEADRIG